MRDSRRMRVPSVRAHRRVVRVFVSVEAVVYAAGRAARVHLAVSAVRTRRGSPAHPHAHTHSALATVRLNPPRVPSVRA